MRKIKYFCFWLLLTMFIPQVYALTYEMDASVDSTSVNVGTIKEINVSLKNIQGTSDGIMSCSLNLQFDSNILLDSKVRTLNSWTMTVGKIYLFDTGSPAVDNSAIFVIPVKVNGNGAVRITDIECSDGESVVEVANKTINFTVLSDNNNQGNNQNNGNTTNNNNNSNNNDEDDAGEEIVLENNNCDLSDIQLSEGTIEFDEAVTEYSVKVSDFESLSITPVLASSTAAYTVERNITEEGNSFVITVRALNGDSKVYTVYVEEETSSVNDGKKGINYTPIFIGIICVLVLINVFRIVKSKTKKK